MQSVATALTVITTIFVKFLLMSIEVRLQAVLLQLSDDDDDDDDDVNSTDVDNTLESDVQTSRYLHHAQSDFVRHQMLRDWHLGTNNYTPAPVGTSGDCHIAD